MNDVRRKRRGSLLAVLGLLLVASGIGTLAWRYDAIEIRSATMAPSLRQGDRALMEEVGPKDVRPGDVVVFDAPWPEADGFPPLVFRVIAVGGAHVECCDGQGRLIVDDVPVDEEYADDGGVEPRPFDVDVPDGHLFVAGDTRAGANDSRAHVGLDGGAVSVEAVVGRLVGTAWPPWRWGVQDAQVLGVADRHPGGEDYPVPYVVALAAIVTGGLALLTGLWRWGWQPRRGRRSAAA